MTLQRMKILAEGGKSNHWINPVSGVSQCLL